MERFPHTKDMVGSIAAQTVAVKGAPIGQQSCRISCSSCACQDVSPRRLSSATTSTTTASKVLQATPDTTASGQRQGREVAEHAEDGRFGLGFLQALSAQVLAAASYRVFSSSHSGIYLAMVPRSAVSFMYLA